MHYHICDSCDAAYINGTKCHEHGCPDAWRDYSIECKMCSSDFTPGERHQTVCDEACATAYWG